MKKDKQGCKKCQVVVIINDDVVDFKVYGDQPDELQKTFKRICQRKIIEFTVASNATNKDVVKAARSSLEEHLTEDEIGF